MKFKINDIQFCKNNSECNPGETCCDCRNLNEDKFSSIEKNYSETIDLTFPNIELNEDNTDIVSDYYWYDKEQKIHIMPLKRYIEYKEAVEKFTFLYLVIKFLENFDSIEKVVRNYIVEKLVEYDSEISFETISYEDIVDILMHFNDSIPDEILEDILLNAISADFTSKIQSENLTLNIVDVVAIKNILVKKNQFAGNDISDGGFNLEHDDSHPCSGCKFHNYSTGENNCLLENYCDDYDEDNPCNDRS